METVISKVIIELEDNGVISINKTILNFKMKTILGVSKEKLLEAPHRIYNVDETGFNSEHSPIYVVGPNKLRVPIPAIVSPRSATTTMISTVSAAGQVVPPYLVFKGKRDVSIYIYFACKS